MPSFRSCHWCKEPVLGPFDHAHETCDRERMPKDPRGAESSSEAVHPESAKRETSLAIVRAELPGELENIGEQLALTDSRPDSTVTETNASAIVLQLELRRKAQEAKLEGERHERALEAKEQEHRHKMEITKVETQQALALRKLTFSTGSAVVSLLLAVALVIAGYPQLAAFLFGTSAAQVTDVVRKDKNRKRSPQAPTRRTP